MSNSASLKEIANEIKTLQDERKAIDEWFTKHHIERGISKRNHINNKIKELHGHLKAMAVQTMQDTGDITEALEIGLKHRKSKQLIYSDNDVIRAANEQGRTDLLNISLNKAALAALSKNDNELAYDLGIGSTIVHDFTIPSALK